MGDRLGTPGAVGFLAKFRANSDKNSIPSSVFGFRYLVGGKGTLTKQLKIFSIFSLHFRSRVTVSHTMLQDIQPCKRPQPALVQDQKAYGTRCSQAVPHPSTIPARRCLTSVIGRERVYSSWYGRRHSVLPLRRC